jgi:hypothetical protein
LIDRRSAKGYNEAESRAMLADLIAKHDGDNLVAALVYNGFATEAQAQRFAQAEHA